MVDVGLAGPAIKQPHRKHACVKVEHPSHYGKTGWAVCALPLTQAKYRV